MSSHTNEPPTCLFIRSWNLHFETPESLKRAKAGSWVPIPNKHDGRGYRRIMAEHDGRTIYGTWIALVQTASKMPTRGILADQDGPISSEDLATKIMATTEEVDRAIEVTMRPNIGWLGTAEWAATGSVEDNLKRIREHLGERSQPYRTAPSPRAGQGTSPRRKARPNNGTHDGNPSRVNGNAQVCSENRLHNSTEQDKTYPSAVSLPVEGRPSAPDDLIFSVDRAKAIICDKILDGKSPGRPWSYDAQQRLTELCASGLPLQEIADIAEYRSIPKNDDVPELKARRDPISETTLVQYWGDELTRARAYLKKNARRATADADPAHWRKFFLWKYGDRVVLPIRFNHLSQTQRDEWHREHDDFEAVVMPKLDEEKHSAEAIA